MKDKFYVKQYNLGACADFHSHQDNSRGPRTIIVVDRPGYTTHAKLTKVEV